MTVVPVLLYHAVTARPPPGLDRFTVAPRQFGDHLGVLRNAGRVGLTVSQFAACLRNGSGLPGLPVVVTFDDGYADFLEAAERLGTAGLPATLYMTTGQIGAARMLTRRQLQSLGGSPVEVGAHSRTHPRLDELAPGRLRDEVHGSKADLEDLLQQPTRSFAYPHGDHDPQVRQTVVDAGFDSAAAVKNAFSHDRDDPFAIARITVTAGTTAERIGQLLQGRGAPTAWARERRTTRAYRSYRRVLRGLRREARRP
jgi:peptidoglycan/xylan/chitin deacetylase (PgdA/CDA1 family)